MATFKPKVLKDENAVAKVFNSRYIAKTMRFFATGVDDNDGKLGRLHFNFDGDSYTDLTNIEIGIPKWIVGMTDVQLILWLKFAICHEQSHRMYTPDAPYKEHQDKLVKYLVKKHKIPASLAKQAVNSIDNGMCDGRIEARFLENHPQDMFMNIFRFGRSQWYIHNDFAKGKNANSHEPADELFDGLFCLTTLATMGTLPMNWANKWQGHGDLYQLMMDARKYVNAFVEAKTFEDGEQALWATVQHIEDWMVALMQKIPVSDASNALQQVVKSQGGNASRNNTGNSSQSCAANAGVGNQAGSSGNQSANASGNQQAGQGNDPMNNTPINSQDPNAQQNNAGQNQGQGSSNSGAQQNNGSQGTGNNANTQQPASPLHSAFQNGFDGQGQGGRIARQEDTYDGDYGTDMNKIVADAIKDAESEMAEDAGNTLIQAEWEDLHARQQEEEDANGYDAQAAKAVADYYSTINHNKRGGSNWAVKFKRYCYNLPQVFAPVSIKNEAKKLNMEFAKILLSKQSFDSRNRRNGLLDTNGLYKLVGLKQRDIFLKKGNPREADYVFYVLMDGSGSMSGDKFNEALRACSLIEESLKGIAPVKIVVFDFYYDMVRHHIVKDFKELPTNNSWAYANSRHASGCNMDGFSIRVAVTELMKRPEKHKVLITLSDGQPNGPSSYSGTRGENDVSEAVLETRKKGVHVFNIFFGESKAERDRYLPSFKHMYRDKGIISCAPSAIGTELLRIVRKELC